MACATRDDLRQPAHLRGLSRLIFSHTQLTSPNKIKKKKKKADQPSQVSRLPLVLPARTPHMASSCVYICRQM